MFAYRVRPVLLVALASASLLAWGCSSADRPRGRDLQAVHTTAALPTMLKQDRWRAVEEDACIASGIVRASPSLTMRSSLGGPGLCQVRRPIQVAALGANHVALRPSATLQCPMVPAIEHWLTTVITPAARRHFGSDVAELKVISSYSCRRISGTARVSEHGRANALDVSAFYLTDGRAVNVKQGWNGSAAERAFLREVHRGACATFNTVLGPNADAAHHDHFHVDLARHGRDGSYRVCR